MHPLLKQYSILVEFLGKALSPDYEIVLHDLRGEDNQVIAIANGNVSGRQTGAPLTNMGLKFIADREYISNDYKVGYCGISKTNAKLFSSTMFIKDEQGELIGMLCVNFDFSRYSRAAESIFALCGHASAAPSGEHDLRAAETFVGNVPDAVRSAIEDATGGHPIPVSRLTMDEKIKIVDILNHNGLFYLKGAVSEVAGVLETSEATIYRYLSKLKN